MRKTKRARRTTERNCRGQEWPTHKMNSYHALPHTTSHCITLPHTTSHYLALPHSASHHLTPPHTAYLAVEAGVREGRGGAGPAPRGGQGRPLHQRREAEIPIVEGQERARQGHGGTQDPRRPRPRGRRRRLLPVGRGRVAAVVPPLAPPGDPSDRAGLRKRTWTCGCRCCWRCRCR